MPVNQSANAAISSVAAASSASDLVLIVNGKTVETGQYVPRAETEKQPGLKLANSQGKTYLAVMLDMEAPYPSASFLSPILHWIQPTLTLSGDKLVSTAPVICDYVPARPPPGSGPHQYVVFIYEQPADFDVSKFALPEGQQTGIGKRIRFDLDAWEKEAGVGKIIACNYFKSN